MEVASSEFGFVSGSHCQMKNVQTTLAKKQYTQTVKWPDER